MSQIYFTSDTHYGHTNICEGVSKWEKRKGGQSTRKFATLEQMNKAIVDGINNKVKADDVLYHLGDWVFGGIKNIWEFRKQINCKNIHLIFGNHDHHIENRRILPNVFRTINHTLSDDNDYKGTRSPVRANELFKSTKYVDTVGTKPSFFLSHYAHRVWNKSHHGRIHLYGHSHASLEDEEWGRSMDVGIDAYYRLNGRYEPFSLTEVLEIMDGRNTKIIDHHNSETN